jgi:hypothetical protein
VVFTRRGVRFLVDVATATLGPVPVVSGADRFMDGADVPFAHRLIDAVDVPLAHRRQPSLSGRILAHCVAIATSRRSWSHSSAVPVA